MRTTLRSQSQALKHATLMRLEKTRVRHVQATLESMKLKKMPRVLERQWTRPSRTALRSQSQSDLIVYLIQNDSWKWRRCIILARSPRRNADLMPTPKRMACPTIQRRVATIPPLPQPPTIGTSDFKKTISTRINAEKILHYKDFMLQAKREPHSRNERLCEDHTNRVPVTRVRKTATTERKAMVQSISERTTSNWSSPNVKNSELWRQNVCITDCKMCRSSLWRWKWKVDSSTNS